MGKRTSDLSDDLQKIFEARHHDPFSILGRHQVGKKTELRVYRPNSLSISVYGTDIELERQGKTDLFYWSGTSNQLSPAYQLECKQPDGSLHVLHDPYSFPPQLSDFDLHLFSEGRHWHAYRLLGAHSHMVDGVTGVLFSVWAPSAERVSVVGNFNTWDGRVHPMRARGQSGVWELFIPELAPGACYKYEVRSDTGDILLKTDPYGQEFELRPATAAIIRQEDAYPWKDSQWMTARGKSNWLHQPTSIYEVHLGSWQRDDDGEFLNYRELAHRLVDYLGPMGFTHIELLPITEHPFDGSWGYQTTGYYAPSSRFGTPDDFRYFVDHCHEHGIGVLLDWAPGHFPKDAFALARFDGTALYEHEDPKKGEHRDWGTLIFNYGRKEVQNFLLSSAFFWLEEFHIDGLRVDAVASMLYLDYSREADDWIPNQFGGRENLEAIEFLRHMNQVVHEQHPGALVMAEESTDWPMVSRPVYLGGLGFSMKWNMGWMHDSLDYISKDPVYRHYDHDKLTFGLLYAFSENFILPFSHDEVVHGKGSMLNKMPGDEWQRFANLRLLYTYMFTMPGKKLLFMGCEFGQSNEWNFDQPLDWWLLQFEPHKGVHSLISDLNKIYRENSALHSFDFEQQGFEWIDCHDASQSVLSYMRRDSERAVLVILNFTPVPRTSYRIGVPFEGNYRVVLNSDSNFYGGSNLGEELLHSEPTHWMNQPHSIELTLPPLAGLILIPE